MKLFFSTPALLTLYFTAPMRRFLIFPMDTAPPPGMIIGGDGAIGMHSIFNNLQCMREPPECKWLQGEGERVCNYLFGDRA